MREIKFRYWHKEDKEMSEPLDLSQMGGYYSPPMKEI